jgi:hypothetical protein
MTDWLTQIFTDPSDAQFHIAHVFPAEGSSHRLEVDDPGYCYCGPSMQMITGKRGLIETWTHHLAYGDEDG